MHLAHHITSFTHSLTHSPTHMYSQCLAMQCVKIQNFEDEDGRPVIKYKIHYQGWRARWEESLPLQPHSFSLSPSCTCQFGADSWAPLLPSHFPPFPRFGLHDTGLVDSAA
jgi:hypothetical protein